MEAAHGDQSNVMKIADISSQLPSMTSDSSIGLAILFNGDPSGLMVDVLP